MLASCPWLAGPVLGCEWKSGWVDRPLVTDDELANACPQIGKTLLERNRKAPDGLLMNTCSGLLKYISALEPKQHFIINILKHMEGTEGGERKGGGRDKKGGTWREILEWDSGMLLREALRRCERRNGLELRQARGQFSVSSSMPLHFIFWDCYRATLATLATERTVLVGLASQWAPGSLLSLPPPSAELTHCP